MPALIHKEPYESDILHEAHKRLNDHVVDISNHLGYLAGEEYGHARGYGTQATQNANPNNDFSEELPFLVLVLMIVSSHAFPRE